MLELVELPRLREPETRPGRQVRLHRDANVEAILAQFAGQVNDPECAHCVQGSGVWASCVSVPGCLVGSCANCHYNNEGSRCSLRKYFLRFFFTAFVVANCFQARELPPIPTPLLVSLLLWPVVLVAAEPTLLRPIVLAIARLPLPLLIPLPVLLLLLLSLLPRLAFRSLSPLPRLLPLLRL